MNRSYSTSGRNLHYKSKYEELRPVNYMTQPRRPERVEPLPSIGLDGISDRFQHMAISSNSPPRRSASTSYRPNPPSSYRIPNRFESPVTETRSPPRYKAPPVNLMDVPVYDNGTDSSYRAANRLKTSSSSGSYDSGYGSRSDRTRGESSRRDNSSYSYKPSFRFEDPSLVPAPLNIRKKSATTYPTDRQAMFAARPSGVEKYRNRHLPCIPSQAAQKQTHDRLMHKNSHDTLTAASETGVTTKAPDMKAKPGKPVLKVDTGSKAARLEKERKASRMRILNAQRAVDSGKWTMYKTCHEMDALNRDERSKVNAYIVTKRVAERKAEMKAQEAKQRRENEQRKALGNLERKNAERVKTKQTTRGRKKGGKGGCTVM